MVRALDITDEPVTTEVVEPETKTEPEFYTSNVIDTVDGLLTNFVDNGGRRNGGAAVYECLRLLAHKLDDLRGENHRLRKRLSAVRSLSEFVHQNTQWTAFSVARGDPNANVPDRLLVHIAERLDKIAQREFAPGRVVTKTICSRCGEVPDERCRSCEGVAPNGNGATWHDILWKKQQVPLNAKMED